MSMSAPADRAGAAQDPSVPTPEQDPDDAGRMEGAAPDQSDAADALMAELAQAPFRFAFPRLVALLERAFAAEQPSGTSSPVDLERVLFRSSPSMAFAAADVQAVAPAPAGLPWRAEVTVNFLGLYGPASPLPAFWSEHVVKDEDGSANLRDLLDLFGHPMVGLAYRIWRHYRLHLQVADGKFGQLAQVALALVGLPRDTRIELDHRRLLPLCGLLARHDRSADVLRSAVSLYFDVPVRVEEWVPVWVGIAPDEQFRLGAPAARLGETVLGERVRDVAGSIRLVLGPLPRAAFEAFLPDGAQRRALRTLLRLVLRDPLDCYLDLVLDTDEPETMVMGGFGLGWTGWLAGDAAPRVCDTGLL